MNNKPSYIFLLFILSILSSCNFNKPKKESISKDSLIAEAPILTPAQTIEHTHLEEGFELQLVASEPQIMAPIAMTFDEQLRIWAVEMMGYMTNVDGSEENLPTGKIILLEDQDQDGIYETRKVIIDSLVLPRALALVDEGLLVAEPPNLWYYELKNDQAVSKTLVDSTYTSGGNVEHQANGLFRGIDGWIYNSGTNKRYKKQQDGWIIERTHYRGQWGLTQDLYGRLFYNNNSQNLLGDYYLPGVGGSNANLSRAHGFSEIIVPDNRTYPSRPTTGVNRGYADGVLDDSLKLTSFTAACGPVINVDPLFGDAYFNNAFVAEPAANLIKRNILEFQGNVVSGEQAYQGKEFLASDDERFRPVSLYNGPDGALYIVDMYRGIIQHKSFLTQYLKDEIKDRSLENYLNCGRIYKVVPKGYTQKPSPIIPDDKQLVENLASEISWKRSKAQQLLIDRKAIGMTPAIRELIKNTDNEATKIHGLWTLEGLNQIKFSDVSAVLKSDKGSSLLKAHAITLLSSIPKELGITNLWSTFQNLASNTDLAPYIAFQLHLIQDPGLQDQLIAQIVNEHPESIEIAHGIISNFFSKEKDLKVRLSQLNLPNNAAIVDELDALLIRVENAEKPSKEKTLIRKYARGVNVFRSTCQPCHGENGEGIEFLAPPLNKSEWVTGEKDLLIAIVLFGMTGPVHVNGHLYETPEVSGEMPGILNNPDLVESDLALLLSYIRKNWDNNASEVTLEDIIKVKQNFKNRKKPFTEEELHQIKEKLKEI